MMAYQTMPRVFDYAKDGDGTGPRCPARPLRRCPTATTVNGKQTVTYTINPAAVWSDGQPITSSDFKYTWDQIANGKDIYDKTGYDKIESVDTTNPKTAVVTFKETFAELDSAVRRGLRRSSRRTSWRARTGQAHEGRLRLVRRSRGSSSGTRA